MKGKTISITIPNTLFNEYNNQASKLKTSRSRVICNILLNEFISRESEDEEVTTKDKKDKDR